MDTKKILIEENTMEEIRKLASQTGENPDELAKRYEKFLGDLLAQVPSEVLEMQKQNSSFAHKQDYKAAV